MERHLPLKAKAHPYSFPWGVYDAGAFLLPQPEKAAGLLPQPQLLQAIRL